LCNALTHSPCANDANDCVSRFHRQRL
jgi:hypothetical protein